MDELYWGCLIFGIIFAFLSVIIGDLLSDALDGMFEFLSIDGPDYIKPMVIVGFITTFGGSGILLTEYVTSIALIVIPLALIVAFFTSVLIYLFYVKPMNNAEVSTGFTYQDLIGKIGEVSIPLPEDGYGEVTVNIGGGNTNQIAKSFEHHSIPSGEKVVVIDVKESVLLVSKLNEFKE